MSESIVEPQQAEEPQVVEQLTTAIQPLMRLTTVQIARGKGKPTVEFVGEVYNPENEAAFRSLLARFEALGYLPLLSKRKDVHVLQALPHVVDRRTGKPWVNALLFILTALSVMYIGALQQGADIKADWRTLALGLPHAATLLSILTVHEFSHYLAARRYGAPVSLPYFAPIPVPPLGTMGAVIVQKSPLLNRKAVFDLGVSGPLGGLIVAIPLLILGLLLSKVEPLPVGVSYTMEGNSIFYYFIKWVIFGQSLPSGGVDVMLHPIAFAAWAGLLVTGLNLLPVGQYDGGHIAYAMWGPKAWLVARGVVVAMFVWAAILLFTGNSIGTTWALLGALGFTMGARHPAPLDDVTPLDSTRKYIGWAVIVLLILILVPIPLTVVP
ncbi:MAG: site-2 protease family protein [Anaerolineae bacterium]|jgi:membrane-associated protease RseP (regulator of RpoE activity)|nr:site-2 protease family protein [Anaerolineae bacterium]